MSNSAIDQANTEFWNELCGIGSARQRGVWDHSLESLACYAPKHPQVSFS